MSAEVEDPRTLAALGKVINRLDVVIDFLKVVVDILPAPAGPPARLELTAGPVTIQGENMQIHDNEQFPIAITAVDSKGQPVAGDAFTATSSDATIVTVVPQPDGFTFNLVAGLPGSAVITVTDGTVSVTEAVDVVPGAVATISVVEGAVTAQ